MNYITNSNIISFFEEIGLSLSQFYTLLWRHVIVVELLKKKYNDNGKKRIGEIFDSIRQIVNLNRSKKRALEYIEQFGDKFWETTEYRVKELTKTIEQKLESSVQNAAPSVTVGCGGNNIGIDLSSNLLNENEAKKLTEEQKTEIISRTRNVISEYQLQELHDMVGILGDDIFVDPQQRYYVLIDRLDEDWAEEKIKVKLIKSLIETIQTFRKVAQVKIIIALRTDLYRRVIDETKGAGFQEEKYETLYLKIRWTREHLEKMLNQRVQFLFRKQYTKDGVKLSDILQNSQIEQQKPIEYILSRTFNRPREAIQFLNTCLEKAEGQSTIKSNVIRSGESAYSLKRIRSLYEEWEQDFPLLNLYTLNLLKRQKNKFELAAIDHDALEKVIMSVSGSSNKKDPIYQMIEMYTLGRDINYENIRDKIISIFYRTGLVGVKLESYLPTQWSFIDEPLLDEASLHPSISLEIHPTFWLALGVNRERQSNR